MNFSEKLKEIRNKEGLSQEQFAEKIGVSRQAITKWETGKGLPDVENMMIIAEIFKITLDELLMDFGGKTEREVPVYTSETVYDIDCGKHFDINIGSAAEITLTSGTDEKLHIRLSSKTFENLGELFKIRLDESRNRLDVNCLNKNKLSRFEVEESLAVEIVLPEKYSDDCELSASIKLLTIKNLHLSQLEYDGDAERIRISGSSGRMEFTSKTDYDITVDKITGRLGINQWRAKSVIHIPRENAADIVNKGRKCNIYYRTEGGSLENIKNIKNETVPSSAADGGKRNENGSRNEIRSEIRVSGMFSEVVVEYA